MRNSAINFFFDTIRKYPNKLCISDEKESLDFRQFFFRASNIAEVLKQDGKINQPVLVYLPKTTSAIVSFAAILMSGNFYVPVDIKSPKKRIQKILENLFPKKIISCRYYQKDLNELSIPPEKITFLDDIPIDVESCSVDELIGKSQIIINKIIDLDPCYVMHTSGSTGIPKGVIVSHRGVIDYIDWAVSFLKVDENEVIGNQAPLFFDNSTLDIYLSWTTGAALHLIPEELFKFPVNLIEYFENKKITLIFFIPSILVNISRLNLLSPGRFPSLKKIIFAGEVMPAKHLAYWQKNLPDRLYVNLYGPTEITVDCTYFVVDRIYEPHESLPIGYPRSNSGMLILNNNDEPAGLNERGEICVRGSSLALGYWNDEETTKKAFVQNPIHKSYSDIIYRTGDIAYKNERGEIIFVGRKDSQIKHMGYRIELGEIETVTMAIPEVHNCCVLYNYKKQEITLFYEGKKEIPVIELRKSLAQILPNYMLPRKIHYLHKMPLNAAGKIDRLRLQNDFFR